MQFEDISPKASATIASNMQNTITAQMVKDEVKKLYNNSGYGPLTVGNSTRRPMKSTQELLMDRELIIREVASEYENFMSDILEDVDKDTIRKIAVTLVQGGYARGVKDFMDHYMSDGRYETTTYTPTPNYTTTTYSNLSTTNNTSQTLPRWTQP